MTFRGKIGYALLHFAKSYRGAKVYNVGIPKLFVASFKSRQLIQHGNAGNNLPDRAGLCSNTLPLYDYAIKTLGFNCIFPEFILFR